MNNNIPLCKNCVHLISDNELEPQDNQCSIERMKQLRKIEANVEMDPVSGVIKKRGEI